MIQEGTKQQLELSSQLESLAQIETFIDDFCEQCSVSEDDYGNILIALTEAVNNAITHGNSLDPNKKVSLNVEGNPSQLDFVVEDEGAGFDYKMVPDPTLPENREKLSGRGIFLMKNLADDVSFENNGSKIKLSFSLTDS